VAGRCCIHKVIDLFSGAGGLSLGAARAGFSVCGAVELDSHAMKTHRRNFPNTDHLETDVSKLTGQSLRDSFKLNGDELAGIIGGPPCQGFSNIGRNDKNDKRNLLFKDFFRIVAEARPKFFLAENVPGILNEKNDELREEALDHVRKHYDVLEPMTIIAKEYGAPTLRKRVFFVGYSRDHANPLTTDLFEPPENVEKITVGEALRGLPTKIRDEWQSEEQGWRFARAHGQGYFASRLHNNVPPGMGDPVAIKKIEAERASGSLGTFHSKQIVRRYDELEPGTSDPISRSYRLTLSGFCPTLRAGTGADKGSYQAVRPIHPTEARVITPREAARLQGFPDWFRFAPSKWHSFRQIGNSVSPILAERILTVILNVL